MRKRKSLLTITTSVLAFFLALVGCSKSTAKSTQEPVESSQSTEALNNVEETAQVNEVARGKTGELFTRRSAIYIPETATLQYTGDTTSYMKSTGNATDVGLSSSRFTVDSGKGETSYYAGINKANYIVLYSKKSDTAAGTGSYIDVSIIGDYQIVSISISFKSNDNYASITVGGDAAALENGEYIIDSSSFRVQNVYKSDGSANEQVQINSITINYEAAAKDATKGLPTQASLSYNYVKEVDSAVDTLNSGFTGISGNSYSGWTGTKASSSISYAGNNAGGNSAIRFRASDACGIVTTANANDRVAKSAVITWDTHTPDGNKQVLLIYGDDTAYESASDIYSTPKGTLIASLPYDDRDGTDNTSSIEFSTSYKYLGFRLKSGSSTSYISSIDIQWDAAPTYTYSNVAIRFGGFMKEALWDRLKAETTLPATVEGYGVMVSTANYLGVNSIEDKYNVAKDEHTIDEAITTICTGNNIKNFFKGRYILSFNIFSFSR